MKSISKEDYLKFIETRDELCNLILEKTKELSLIMYGRPPIGYCYDRDFFDLNAYDQLFIQYESSSCQDTNYDSFNLPLEFLTDESFPEKYKLAYAEKKRRDEEQKIKMKLMKKLEDQKNREIFEMKEYERLKLKYDNKEIKCTIRKEKGIVWCANDCIDRDTCLESAK